MTALGHSDAQFNKVLNEQSAKLSHASNVYWNEYAGELAKALIEGTKQHGGLGLQTGETGGKVFFANSGTEANEGALKFARKYGKETAAAMGKEGSSKTGIVCFTNAFHGRSMGALSVTPNPKYQGPFAPLIPDVKVGEYNDMDDSKIAALIDESTCGVIVEPIQGEGGVGTGKIEWLEKIGKRCREVGAVLIFDEIQVSSGHTIRTFVFGIDVQCGLFRSGTMWAHSKYPKDAQPDIVTMAKPLANGFPIGAIMVRDKVAQIISVGSHGTTFGGQPLATALGVHVLSRLNNEQFLATLNDTAAHLDELISRLPQLFPSMVASDLRGRGLIRGIPFKDEKAPAELVKLARERGVLLLTAGKDAVRLVPALIVNKEQCDHAVGVIESCLSIMEEQGWGKKE